MQAPAPTALPVKNAKAEKPSGRHGDKPKVGTDFQKVLAEKAKGVTEAAEKNRSAVLAALQKALGKAVPSSHADGLARHGLPLAVKHPVPVPAVLKHDKHAEDPQKKPVETAETRKAPEKKHAPATAHSDGMAALVPVLAGLSLGIPAKPKAGNPDPAPKGLVAPLSQGHAAEAKGSGFHLHVVDARTKPAPTEDPSAVVKPARLASSDKDAPVPVLARDGGVFETGTREAGKPNPPAAPPSFANAVDRLREMAGSELTRAAGMVIRDGGGEIKLVLKPESLGSVRIRMNLVDNAIEGRIIVDSSAVKHVFEGSLSSLTRALAAEGFQTASLSVSVGGQNADNGKPDREPEPRSRRVEAAGNAEVRAAGWDVPDLEGMSVGELLVNLFV